MTAPASTDQAPPASAAIAPVIRIYADDTA